MQIASNILAKRLEFVTEMAQEGLLTENDANLFYKEISDGNLNIYNTYINRLLK